MSIKEETQVIQSADTVTEQQPQEEIEVEEPVDIELQQQMKSAKIDESAFTQGEKGKGNKKEDTKKSKKNKGQDFLEYASKNNIEINIEYEENKFGAHGKRQYEKKGKDQKYEKDNINAKHYHGEKRNYVANTNNHHKSYPHSGENKFTKPQNTGYYNQNKRPQYHFGGNKFDACNNALLQPGAYQPRVNPVLDTDEAILSFIEELFTPMTLNKDIYLRKKISEEGSIDIQDLVYYYPIKKYNIGMERLVEVIRKSESFTIREDGDTKMLQIKKWKELQLITIEEIVFKKREMNQLQYHQQQQNNIYYQGPFMNYIHMENNYFMPSQGYYPMPGYSQPMFLQQAPQESVQQGGNEEQK